MNTSVWASLVALALLAPHLSIEATAADWHAAVDGKADGLGTPESPWDLISALGGNKKLAPGDTLWIAPGTYKHPNRKLGSPGFEVRLAGAEGKPICVRGRPGRVTLDGGLTVQPLSDWLWIRDLEILVSENFSLSRTVAQSGSRGIRALENVLFDVPLQLGYTAPYNEDCEVRGNVLVGGGLSVNKFRKAVQADNLVLGASAPRPKEPALVRLRPNRYDPNRAHVAAFNWAKRPAVDVPASGFLRPGDHYRLLDPRDFYGKPIASGSFDGQPLRLPVEGEFAAAVLIRD